MKAVPPQLVAFLLLKRPFYQADLFTFNFLNAIQPPLLLASTDQDITDIVSGNTWYGSSPALGVALLAREPAYPSATKSRWNIKNTVDVPTLDVELNSDGTDYGAGLNIKAMAHNGLFDGCMVTFQRAIMPNFGDTSLGLVTLFLGPVGPAQITARGVKITVKGSNVKLQQFMPRNRFELGCIHALYSPGCGVARGSFATANTVGAGSTASFIVWGSGVPVAVNKATMISEQDTVGLPILLPTTADTPSGVTLPFASTGGVVVGATVTDPNVSYGTTVLSVVTNASVTLNQPVASDVPSGEPISFGPTVVVANVGSWVSDQGVSYLNGGALTFVPLGTAPVSGQYTVSGGVYVFSEADAGAAVTINYTCTNGGAGPTQYGLGYVTFTSGVCEGQVRTIQASGAGGFQLMYPLYDVPAPGDTYTVAFGCDKTLATCTSVFNNAARYRGFPFIPPATMAV